MIATFEAMLAAGVNFLFLNVVGILSVAVLVKGLVSSNQKEKSLTAHLKQEGAHLSEAMARLERETLERCEEILRGEPVLVKSHDPRLRAQEHGVRFAD